MLKYLACIFCLSAMAAPTPPAKLTFKAKNGNVAFDHAAHLKREKDNCKTCHPKPYAQDTKAPLGFKGPHKPAEDKQLSCGKCHRAGGTAFETKGNCTNGKCHARPAAKK
ncbi:MAG: c(7)-type cytochrome triheme domain-containing protein [Bryobacteraceae bacterium]